MTVHLNIWGEWAPCRATVRACPRVVHLDVSIEEARNYPQHVIERLFDVGEATVALSDGTRQWRDSKGELHREGDLPAVISPDGSKQWYRHGKRHRAAGPAIMDSLGEGRWYKNGIFYIVGGKRAVQDEDTLEQLIALSPRRKRQIENLRRQQGL